MGMFKTVEFWASWYWILGRWSTNHRTKRVRQSTLVLLASVMVCWKYIVAAKQYGHADTNLNYNATINKPTDPPHRHSKETRDEKYTQSKDGRLKHCKMWKSQEWLIENVQQTRVSMTACYDNVYFQWALTVASRARVVRFVSLSPICSSHFTPQVWCGWLGNAAACWPIDVKKNIWGAL